jgi:hypothetical protein
MLRTPPGRQTRKPNPVMKKATESAKGSSKNKAVKQGRSVSGKLRGAPVPELESFLVLDDSMAPRILPGDILVIEDQPHKSPLPGDIVLAKLATGEWVCRRYEVFPKITGFYLAPDNAKFPALLQGIKELRLVVSVKGNLRSGAVASYANLKHTWFDLMQGLEPSVSKAVALITAMDEALSAAIRNSDYKTLRRRANGLSWISMDVVKSLEDSCRGCMSFREHLQPGAEAASATRA